MWLSEGSGWNWQWFEAAAVVCEAIHALVTGILSEMLCCTLKQGLSVQGPPGEATASSGLPRI